VEVLRALGTARHDHHPLPHFDGPIKKLWASYNSVFGVSDLNQKISLLTVTVTILALTVKRNPCAKGIRNFGVFQVTAVRYYPIPDVSARRPGLEPIFEALRR
jgi:hypothetical protein